MAATQKVRLPPTCCSQSRARDAGGAALCRSAARATHRARGFRVRTCPSRRPHASARTARRAIIDLCYTLYSGGRENDAARGHRGAPLTRVTPTQTTSPSAALVPGAELERVAAAAAAAGRCVLDRLFWRVHEAGADVPRVPCAPLQGAAHRRARRAKNQAHVSRRVFQRRRRPTHAVERELGRGPPAAGLLHAAGARSQGPREVVDVLWPHAGAGRHAHQGARREHAGAGAKAGQGGRGPQYSCAGDARARRAAASHTAVALDCHLRRYHCSKLNCCKENPADVDRARKITRRIF